MSQEKTLEDYKNKDWLFNEYIKNSKTISQIAKECGVGITTIYRYKKKFGLKNKYEQKRDLLTKEFLYNEYIVENKTVAEISEEKNINRAIIFRYLKKYNLSKSKIEMTKAKIKRVQDISKQKYGCDHYNSSDIVIKKRKKTCLLKYGTEHYLRSEEYKNREDKRNTIVFGKSIYEWAEKYNITNIIVYRWFYKNKNCTKDELLQFLNSYEAKTSNIESYFAQQNNLKIYNRYYDLELFPHLKYKPDFKLDNGTAINVDGLYWHSENIKSDNKYHFNMRKEYENEGIRIFQFREDEVISKIKILKSITNNHLNKSERIFARKTRVTQIPHNEASKFLNENHMMGEIKAKHIALKLKNNIIAIMSYKIYNNILKIERFCTKCNTSVIGGFSKLLSYVEKNNKFNKIYYWVDLRYGTGYFLSKLGFVHKRDTLGWKWTDFRNTYNRLQCRANMDNRKLSEKEHAHELGWSKIYDAGQRLWERA